MAPRHGVLVVDKPAGPTSHDVVDRVRRALGERQVGHTGTLDPFATGVLVVCVGKATRLSRFLAEGDKVYAATVRLGFATATDDLQGEPLSPPRAVRVDPEALAAAARSLVGPLDQVPPAFSAKRVEGRRLYERARAGEPTPRQPSRVHVEELSILAVRGDEVDILVRCSPGTYVRALARDLGDKLGVGGHLTALRRLASSGFSVDDAVPGDSLTPHVGERLRPLSDLLLDWPGAKLRPAGLEAVKHGRDLGREDVTEGFPDPPGPEHLRLLDPGGALVGIATPLVSSLEGSTTLRLHPGIVLVE
jgi:tRNA pseudouridine55 synthase